MAGPPRRIGRAALLAAAVALAGAVLAGAAQAEDAPAGNADLRGIAIKAVTFEVLSSTIEAGIFTAFYGVGSVSVPAVFAVSFITSGALYVAHEMAWNAAAAADSRPAELGIVSAKSATYRVFSTLRSFAVGTALGGGRLAGSAAYAVTVAVADTALYAANEYVFSWLRHPPPAAAIGAAP
ncbi:hypothetical protein STAQ_31460 [Allostella sp. ATCC 35155]|nr:hypothetical protein STAQ_31460 [Stella sp. ATCC 35155]